MDMLGDMNLSLVFAAIGSAFGVRAAGMSAIGSWKKAYMENKPTPFLMVVFVGMPLSQTIYGFILRDQIRNANWGNIAPGWPMLIGAVAGIAIGLSAFFQGKAGAKACDAITETGKGGANYIMVLGIIETIALFVMIFAMIALPK